MKKILFALFFLLPATALAQDVAVNRVSLLKEWTAAAELKMPKGKCAAILPNSKETWVPCTAKQRQEQIENTFNQYITQDVIAAANKKAESRPEEKAKPIIIPAAKMQELSALRKDLQLALLGIENAQLKINELNKLIETAKADGQKAKTLEVEFWRKLGINPEELPTKWEASDGQNGDIILKRKEEPAEKPKQ